MVGTSTSPSSPGRPPATAALLGRPVPGERLLIERGDDAGQLFCVLLLFRQDLLKQAPGGRVIVPEVADDLAVGADGDPLGDEVLLYHFKKRSSLHVLRVAP